MRLGEWSWYVGQNEHDDAMLHSVTREQAIIDGKQEYAEQGRFYIIEARMAVRDEKAMAAGNLDVAPFAETRNGEWIKP